MDKKKKMYEVQTGYSVLTKRGTAHCGGVITADYFSDPEKGQKNLEDLEKAGKVKLVTSEKKKNKAGNLAGEKAQKKKDNMTGGASQNPSKKDLKEAKKLAEKAMEEATKKLEDDKSSDKEKEAASKEIKMIEIHLKKIDEALKE